MNDEEDVQTTKKIGLGMSMVASLLFLALLGVFFHRFLEQERNPNRDVSGAVTDGMVREIVLERNRYGHYLAGGRINGQDVEFMVDTGASDVSIPASTGARLGLRAGYPRIYNTANGPITAYTTEIARLELGNIVLHQVPASLNPNAEGPVLLGMSFLKHLEFTQRGDVLVLRQYPSGADQQGHGP